MFCGTRKYLGQKAVRSGNLGISRLKIYLVAGRHQRFLPSNEIQTSIADGDPIA